MKALTGVPPESDHRWVETPFAVRIERRQRLVDELKLQVHLGTRAARERVGPLLKKVELDLRHVKEELRRLDESDASGRPQIEQSLEHVLLALEESLEQARRSSERGED